MDMISNLPDHLIHCIIEKMPIECALRTIYLSRQWWYMWHNMKITSITSRNTEIQPFTKMEFEIVGDDPIVEKLNLSNKISIGYGQRLEGLFSSLERLALYDINLCDLRQVTGVFHLIRSSPNLKELQIHGYSPANTDQRDQVLSYWEEQQRDPFTWRQLSVIKIDSRGDYSLPLHLIKLLLAASPLLDELIYKIHDKAVVSENICYYIMGQILDFHRPSLKAQFTLSACMEGWNVVVDII